MTDQKVADEAAQAEGAKSNHIRAMLPGWDDWHDIEADVTDVPPASVDAGEAEDEQQAAARRRDARADVDTFLLRSLQMQNLVVLVGSGASYDADGPSMGKLWDECTDIEATQRSSALAKARYDNDGDASIEELLSRLDVLLAFGEDEDVAALRSHAIQRILELCRVPGEDSAKLDAHREFLRRLSRRRSRDGRFKLFTTNYDRCFERAAGELGLVAIDGFSFSLPRRFDPRFFDYDIVSRVDGAGEPHGAFINGVFQYYKLHGSVDWRRVSGSVVQDQAATGEDVALVYPASTKFRSSYQQPYLELMARYLNAVRAPNTCIVLIGFGFNDDHLSEPILSALESSPHLRVVVVTPDCEERCTDSSHPMWKRLGAAKNRDLGLIGATFAQFVELVPNLRALGAPERLAKAISEVAKT